MIWQLCNKSSEFLVDLWGGCDDSVSWQTAKKHFKDKGYTGSFLLIKRAYNGNFRVYNINIPEAHYDLYSEFDMAKHKLHYVNYLEIVIESDGHIMYAVPSHQELMIRLACKAKNMTRNQLDKACPPEYYGDFIKWLSMQSGAIAVWDAWYEGDANEAQKQKLHELKKCGLYRGTI